MSMFKVYSYAQPHCRSFEQTQFATFGQFQNAIQEWFGIPIDEQKVLKDKKIISLWKTSKFSELKLTSKSHLLVLTKSPTSSKRKNKASENKNSAIDERIIEGNIEPHPSSSQVTQNNEASNVKLIRCLSDVAVDILVTNFIKALNIPNGQLLLLEEPKLRFILQKVTANNETLKNLLLDRINIVKMALLDLSKVDSKRSAPSSLPADKVAYLTKLGFPQANAIRTLQITRNDLYAALTILCGNSNKTQAIDFESRAQDHIQQFKCISSWLGQQSSKPIVLYLKNSPQELGVFVNYWRHACPQLSQIMVKWYPYIGNLINYHFKQIKQ